MRAHLIKREQKLSLAYHPGARLVFADGTPDILAYPRDRPAWGRLCRLLTAATCAPKKATASFCSMTCSNTSTASS